MQLCFIDDNIVIIFIITLQFSSKFFQLIQYFTTCPFLGFIDKNRDKFSSDLLELLHGSEFRLLKLLFDDVYDYDDLSVIRDKHPTITNHFRKSLDNLIASLEQKEPFFINCIVPNAIKRPLVNSRLILSIEMSNLTNSFIYLGNLSKFANFCLFNHLSL